MGKATDFDALSKACKAGVLEACAILRESRMAAYEQEDIDKNKYAEGGLLADSSRTWRMESDYPEFEKGIADRLSKERVPEQEIEEQFNYSPLQRGYQEGGEIDFDTTGSMLDPTVPLDFNEDMPMGDEMMMEEEMMMEDEEDILSGLSPEDQEILFQAMSDYPELEEILNILGMTISNTGDSPDVFDEEGSVEGPGTGTSDSIPAQLSDGEFVFTAKSVQHIGVDKLRKMMAKAEEDYDEGEAKQDYAQMGDVGFAAGGLLTRADYFEKGGEASGTKIRNKQLGPAGMTYTKSEINNILTQLGVEYENMNNHIVKLGNGRFKIRNINLKSGGTLESDYPQGVTDKEGYDKMINQHHDEWSPSDGIPGEGNPHIGEESIMRRKRLEDLGFEDIAKEFKGEQKGLGTRLMQLLRLDPVKYMKNQKGNPTINRESSLLELV